MISLSILVSTLPRTVARRRAPYRLMFSTVDEFPARKHKVPRDILHQRTEDLVARVKNPFDTIGEGESRVSTTECFDTLEAWMERAMHDGELQDGLKPALALLRAMEENMRKGSLQTVLVPSLSFYEVTLQALAVSSKGRENAMRCEKILGGMISNCQSFIQDESHWRMKPVAPSTKSFNICMDAWAHSSDLEAGVHAENLLDRMAAWSDECQLSRQYEACFPTSITFANIVNAWARSGHKLAPERSMETLMSLISTGSEEHLSQQLFNAVINVWAKSDRGRSGASQCDEVVNTMIRLGRDKGFSLSPNSVTIASQIAAWAVCERKERSGSSADRAEELLHNSIQYYQQGQGPKPNQVCFTNCILARSWATRTSGFSPRCEELWDTLSSLYEKSGFDLDLRPDTYMGNAVLAAYARDKHKSDMSAVSTFLKKMERFSQPDIVSYNTVLNMMARRGLSKSALKLLKQLEEPSSLVESDTVSYNCVLTALARDPNVPIDRVESQLEKMITMSNERVDFDVDKASFTITIDAWARSGRPDRIEKAFQVVQRMTDISKQGQAKATPDIFVFTALLKVCATVNASDRQGPAALEVAIKAMDAIDSGVHGVANDITYSTAAKAFRKVCPDEADKRRLLMGIFKKSAASGNLSKSVFHAVSQYGVSLKHLKPSWSKNVPEAFRPHSMKGS